MNSICCCVDFGFLQLQGPASQYYYLVDDSISMTEPKQMNSGIPQGKFLTRQRLPTGQGDRVVHRKDLNCAMDLIVYGKVSLRSQSGRVGSRDSR